MPLGLEFSLIFFSRDSDYKVHAEKMKTHALEVRTAISKGNYDDARNSAKAISQACSACHADYR